MIKNKIGRPKKQIKIDGYAEHDSDVYDGFFVFEERDGKIYYPFQYIPIGIGHKYGFPQKYISLIQTKDKERIIK